MKREYILEAQSVPIGNALCCDAISYPQNAPMKIKTGQCSSIFKNTV
jgi:hypothetical protein